MPCMDARFPRRLPLILSPWKKTRSARDAMPLPPPRSSMGRVPSFASLPPTFSFLLICITIPGQHNNTSFKLCWEKKRSRRETGRKERMNGDDVLYKPVVHVPEHARFPCIFFPTEVTSNDLSRQQQQRQSRRLGALLCL
jgi:hypothetical protein